MAKTRVQKEASVKDLNDKIGRMKALVFANFDGLSVKETSLLRRELRQAEVDYLVVKKSLLRRALSSSGLDGAIADQIEGGISLAVGYADEVIPAKLLQQFSKDHKQIKLVGGIVEGRFLDAAQVTELAKLPGRDGLIAQTIWTIKGPLTGLVNVLAGNIRNLINVISAIKDKQPAAV